MSPRRNYDDDESSRDVESDTSSGYVMDKDERKEFVARVYAILSGYLLFAFVLIFTICYIEEAREFCNDYYWIAFIFMIVALILYLVLVCCPSVARSFPANFIILTIHNICFSAVAAWISSAYNVNVVWMAFLSTAIITVLISLFAKFAPCDVTGCGLFFCIAFLAMGIFTIIASIVVLILGVRVPILWLVISGIMVGLLSFYLMFITQLILGGRRGEIGTDDTVLAVILLFTTIMEIFMYLLRIVGAVSGD